MRRGLVALWAVVMVAAGGCSPWTFGRSLGSASILIPGKEACGVKLGSTKASVYLKLGRPSTYGGLFGIEVWSYEVAGWLKGKSEYLRVVFFGDKVEAVRCFGGVIRGPDGSEWLKAGESTLRDVLRRYGDPLDVLFVTDDDGKVVYDVVVYPKIGLSVLLDGGGVVVGFVVFKPEEE